MEIGTTVVNRHHAQFEVYIGRGTIWGNQWSHDPRYVRAANVCATREEAIARYREWFLAKVGSDERFRRDTIMALRGKVLGCSCKPLACHGDVIAGWLNGR